MTGGRAKTPCDSRPSAPVHSAAVSPGRCGQGLPRSMRLLRPGEFAAVFDRGARQVGRYMVLWTLVSDSGAVRLGVVTSKRAFHRAVDRVRVRRKFREAFRRNRAGLGTGTDVVLVGRTAALEARYDSLESELLKLAGYAGLTSGRKPGS